MSNLDVVNQLILMLSKWWVMAAIALMLLARSRNTSASTLHAILLFVLLALCSLPWLQQFIPVFHIKIIPAQFAESSLWGPLANFAVAYLAVVAGLWTKLFWQLHKLRQFKKCAKNPLVSQHKSLLQELRRTLSIRRPITLICSEEVGTPFTFGWLAPVIVLPSVSQHWDAGRLRRFLLHELAHVDRNDWLTKILARLLVSVFWILPVAWMLLHKIEWFAELACDDAVIRAEGRRAEYADDLLEMTACGQPGQGAVALIENHGHYERIAAVLDGGRMRARDPAKFWPYATVFCAVLVLIATLRLAPTTPPLISPYSLMPLVVVATETESEVQMPPMKMPVRPPKILAEELPTTLPQPPVEIPDLENSIWERPFPMPDQDKPVSFISVDRTQLKPLYMPLPEYPKRALKKNIQGRVVAEFEVLPDGRVQGVTIVAAEPARYFDQSVKTALQHYRYPPQPALITGMTEVFEFKLREDAHLIPAAQK